MIEVGDDGGYLCVPALTVQQLRKHREKLKTIMVSNFINADDSVIDDFAAIAYEATVRNHPEMTLSEFFELLDLRVMSRILVALLGGGDYEIPDLGARPGTAEHLKLAVDAALGHRLNGRMPDA
jgi:hypothetical protein